MQFSKATIVAAAAFFASVSAAPAGTPPAQDDRAAPRISHVLQYLETNGNVEWTTTPDGGRVATIPQAHVESAHAALTKRFLETRGGPGADVGGFTNIGNIAQQAASYACEKSGEWGVSATIESQATDACSNFLKNVPGVPQAETVWNIYQGARATDSSGGNFITSFRYFYNTASAPSLTKQICTEAYQKLTSDFCQGKDSNNANTRGGEIKIGKGDDYIMIGLDPNSA